MNQQHRIIRTRKEFEFWLGRAKTGDTIIYHIGDLAYDRYGMGEYARIIDEMAAVAWEFAKTQELHLLQRKVASSTYEYLAVKTMPKNMDKLRKLLRSPLPASQIDGPIRSSSHSAILVS